MVASRISQRALPGSMPRYMAASASRSSSSGSAPPAHAVRTPKLAVTYRWWPSSSTGARRPPASRSATRRGAPRPPGRPRGHAACGRLAARTGEQDRELVAAEAGDEVIGAQHSAQALGHHDEQAVARLVAERVVDHLEVVEVHEDDGELALALVDRGAQALQEQRAVRQP